MRICVEGPNGAGKSTLINHLKDKYGLTYYHSNNETENTLDYHLNLIENDNVICDRFNLGEIIYPVIYARKSKMKYSEHETLFKRMRELGVIFVIFVDTNGNVLSDRLKSRGDTEEVLENSEVENDLFIAVDKYLEKKYNDILVTIDISKVNDQILYFENILAQRANNSEDFRLHLQECIERANKLKEQN